MSNAPQVVTILVKSLWSLPFKKNLISKSVSGFFTASGFFKRSICDSYLWLLCVTLICDSYLWLLSVTLKKKSPVGSWWNHQNGEISSRRILGQNGLQLICYCFMVISITNLGIWRIWIRAMEIRDLLVKDLYMGQLYGAKGFKTQLNPGFWLENTWYAL